MKTGAEQLKDWMHRRRFMQREAADHFGWDETYISQLVNGRRLPGLDNAIRIERETGIPVEAWASSELGTADEPVAVGSPKSKITKASSDSRLG